MHIFSLLLTCGLAAAPPAPQPQPSGRTVPYGDKDILLVHTRLRYTTLIELPKTEQILDFVCGDKEFWVVNGVQNFAFIKPSKAGARTNLNLITAAGNVYSFVLHEVGDSEEPDMKLFVEPRDGSLLAAMGHRNLFSAEEVKIIEERAATAERQIREAREEAAQAAINEQKRAADTIAKAQSELPIHLHFDYQFARNERPFLVSSIYHDGKFTYIKSAAQELPALYEIKDGKPNLIEFPPPKDGVYTIPKVLDNGYLQIGRKKLNFYRKES